MIKLCLIFTLGLTIKSHAQDLISDLVLDIPFSGEVYDVTGFSTPILSGLETYAEDRFGNTNCAIYFSNATDEYVEFPVVADNNLIVGEDFTVSFWFRMDNFEVADYESLFRKNDFGMNGFDMAVYDQNTPVSSSQDVYLWDDDWNADSDLFFDTTTWHHYVLVGTDSLAYLYRDNVLRNSASIDELDADEVMDNYYIGKFYKGYLDDLKGYKRALDISEINALFELEGNCATSGLEEKEISTPISIQYTTEYLMVKEMPIGNKTIAIYDLMGRQILVVDKIQEDQNSIDLTGLTNGVYIVSVSNSNDETVLYSSKFSKY